MLKNEIDSIALGAKQLYDLKESALIVSTGTGTACVHFDDPIQLRTILTINVPTKFINWRQDIDSEVVQFRL